MRVEALVLPVDGGAQRLPRWTKQELILLIQAKRFVENNRQKNILEPPKWSSISSYCQRHGMNRGPVQCRKRWTNLSSDFNKIKLYHSKHDDSFWVMRNDIRRHNSLPGLFDKDIYDILDDAAVPLAEQPAVLLLNQDQTIPISVTEKQHEPFPKSSRVQGSRDAEKRQTDEVPASTTQQQEERRRKRKKRQYGTEIDDDGDENLQNLLIEALDESGKLLRSQIEAHYTHLQLEREQRNHQMASLISVLNKFADSVNKVADKL